MSKINDGGSAFPQYERMDGGMSLRDYFAAKAVSGLLSDSEVKANAQEFAERAYAVADAMIEARKS